MQRMFPLLKRFGRDERGVFGVLFGLMAIILIAVSGAVVDYVSLEQSRNRAQIALDAAALALQPDIFNATSTAATIKDKAQALVIERIGDSRIVATLDTPIIKKDDGSLYLSAQLKMPTIFVSLVGVTEMSARIQSEATRKKLAIEVAFVLDNSGSMSNTGAGNNGTRQRIQFLKDAANCATNILFYKDVVDSTTNPDTCVPKTGATKLDDVKVGVVPFTMFVNVGSSNLNASWVDKGSSVISNDNFDDGRTPPGPINRATLFAAGGQTWEGCMEARAHIKTGTRAEEYLDTDDTIPLTSNGNTLFTPLFAPDIADSVVGTGSTNSYLDDLQPAICDRPATLPLPTTCVALDRRTGCNAAMSNGGTCNTITPISSVIAGPVNFTSSALYPDAFYGAHSTSCACRNNLGTWLQTGGSGNNRTFDRTYTCVLGYIPTGLTTRQQQERICKYYNPPASTSDTRGPNADCGNSAILPLTSIPSSVTNSINAMVALGGTNIHEGAAWGYRVLSPTQPFTEGNAYGEATSKVMILMTDGENTTYNLSGYCDGTTMRTFNGNCYNSAYGYPYNSKNTDSASSSGGNIERLGSLGTTNAALVTELNNRTLQTCANAKAAGIVVYTIGLATNLSSQSTQAVVESMLTQCASSPDRASFPQTPGALKQIFQDIANELTQLRLAQ